MEKSELTKLVSSNSARITYEDNINATSSAWTSSTVSGFDLA